MSVKAFYTVICRLRLNAFRCSQTVERYRVIGTVYTESFARPDAKDGLLYIFFTLSLVPVNHPKAVKFG